MSHASAGLASTAGARNATPAAAPIAVVVLVDDVQRIDEQILQVRVVPDPNEFGSSERPVHHSFDLV
jgi:hypothetical protein